MQRNATQRNAHHTLECYFLKVKICGLYSCAAHELPVGVLAFRLRLLFDVVKFSEHRRDLFTCSIVGRRVPSIKICTK